MSGFDRVPRVLRRLEARFAGQLSSFELMWNDFYEYVSKGQLQHRPQPMPPVYALYALMIGMPLLGWGMLSAASPRRARSVRSTLTTP